MTKEKTLFESKGRQERAELAALLHDLADQIAAGSLTLGEGDAARTVALPQRMGLELALTREGAKKGEKGRRRYELELEMTWGERRSKRRKKKVKASATEAPSAEPVEPTPLLAPLEPVPLLENPERILLEAPDEEE